MRITLIGPRSVGKSTISKYLAKKLEYYCLESDHLMDEELKPIGGLDKTIKTKNVYIIAEKSPEIVKKALSSDNVVLDLAGGAVSSINPILKEAVNSIVQTISERSKVVGLIPYSDTEDSISFLFKRESQRPHFRDKDPKELLESTSKDYKKLLPVLNEICNFIVFTEKKPPKQIADEIIGKLFE